MAEPDLGAFLTWRLHRVAKLTDKASTDAYSQEFGLPVGEARCLAAIGSVAPLSVNDLAAGANLDKGQASRAAQGLVERGLVRKEASRTDARGVVLTLTRPGHKLWEGVMALIARRTDQIFGCLSAAERRQLAAMLDRVLEHSQQGQ